MTHKELASKVGDALHSRGIYGFRMTYLEKASFVSGVGIELCVGEKLFRNAWIVKNSDDPAALAENAARWVTDVRAAPEKLKSAT